MTTGRTPKVPLHPCTLAQSEKSSSSFYQINKLRFQSTEAEEAKYSEVYTEEGKQVLVLYATEYGFSEEVLLWLIFIFLALVSVLLFWNSKYVLACNATILEFHLTGR